MTFGKGKVTFGSFHVTVHDDVTKLSENFIRLQVLGGSKERRQSARADVIDDVIAKEQLPDEEPQQFVVIGFPRHRELRRRSLSRKSQSESQQ